MLAQDLTIYLINGSSLGGGEMDAIVRARLSNGVIIAASDPVSAVLQLARKQHVPVHKMNYLSRLPKDRSISLHLSRFIRDISLLPKLLKLKLCHGHRLTIVVGVHSDPLSGLEPVKLRLWVALRFFELFCLVFSKRIRLVSRRQMRTFPLVAKSRRFFIDPPCSLITLTRQDKAATRRDLDFVFIGRISNTKQLGDAKNAAFLLDLARSMHSKNMIHIFGDGNNGQLIDSLADQPNVALHAPLIDVAPVLSRTQCLIVPSLHEGYCLIVREASLLGCKVLATPAIAYELWNLPGVKIMSDFSPRNWLEAGGGQ